MSKQFKTIGIIGDGGWGTTLAIHLCRQGHDVTVWGPFPPYIKRMRLNHHNAKFLPGIKFPPRLKLEESLSVIVNDSDLIVFAIPSKFAQSILNKMKKLKVDYSDKAILSVTKGIETTTLKRISEMIKATLGSRINLAVLSGPTIAPEVAKGIASTAVVASKNKNLATRIQHLFNTETFRIYTNSDIPGVELGGSVKNVIAIASGVCDGLKLGSNTKAAILTRGLAEMMRLGRKMGAKPETLAGLSGLGDLATTCFSPNSRNRTVGQKLGEGQSISQIMSKMEMVAEGVETVKAMHKLSKKYNVSLPISSEVYNIIYRKKKPANALRDLMTRKTKSE